MGRDDVVDDHRMLLPIIKEINTIRSIRIGLLRLNDASKEGCFDLSFAEEVVHAS